MGARLVTNRGNQQHLDGGEAAQHRCAMPDTVAHPRLPKSLLVELAIGFAYWFALVLVLEPGNIERASGALPIGREVARLIGAGALGASMTPLVFALVQRLPIEGPTRWERAASHALAAAGIAIGLIVLAGILAWVTGLDREPLLPALRDQLTLNGLLLFFATVALDGIGHAVLFYRRALSAADPAPAPSSGYLSQVTVKARGTLTLLDLADVAWIEAQGNYLALHVGGAAHLIRETLARFESKLDPNQFARVHRSAVVAVGRIRSVERQAGGDAKVLLDDGSIVRMSRSYSEAVKTKIGANSPRP
jgi:hypothetical protein